MPRPLATLALAGVLMAAALPSPCRAAGEANLGWNDCVSGGGLSDLSSGRDYSRPDYPYGIFVLTADDRCSLGTEASLRRPMTPTRARAAEPQAVVKVSGVS